jgi:hypothetical protein
VTSPTYIGYTGAQAAPVATPDGSFGHVYAVEPEGFSLKLADFDRAMFNQMLTLIREGLDLGLMTNEDLVKIADVNGDLHEITVLRFRQIMVGYGFYYKALWDSFVTPQPE